MALVIHFVHDVLSLQRNRLRGNIILPCEIIDRVILCCW